MSAILWIFGTALAFLATCSLAHAYLDPVTGSLVIQGLIAAVAGIIAGVKSIRMKIASGFNALIGRRSR